MKKSFLPVFYFCYLHILLLLLRKNGVHEKLLFLVSNKVQIRSILNQQTLMKERNSRATTVKPPHLIWKALYIQRADTLQVYRYFNLFMARWETITTDWTALVSLLCQRRDSILITRQSISLAFSNDVTTIYLLTIRKVIAGLKHSLIYPFACSFCSFH